MKAELKVEKEFRPVDFVITIENQKEMDFLQCLFANITVSRAEEISGVSCDSNMLAIIYNGFKAK